MTNIDIDELLRDHAQRQADREPPPPSLDALSDRAAHQRRPRWSPRLAIAASVIIVAALAATTATITHTHPTTTPAASRSTQPAPVDLPKGLWQIALREAALLGGTHVTAEAVHSTQQTAERYITGDTITGDTHPSDTHHGEDPGWVVQIHGTFTPPGPNRPSGHVLTLFLDDPTFRIAWFSLQNQPHDLSRLGPVRHLGSADLRGPSGEPQPRKSS
jgi:hypothetical protein